MIEQSSFSTATTWSERFPTRVFSVSVADHIRASEESRSAFLFTKRIVDLLLGSVLLVFATPIILAAMLLIWLTDRGPALFGHRCLPFRMLKLRTMQIGSERDEEKLLRRSSGSIFLKIKDDPRVTRFGRLLRWSSIDELPQLINDQRAARRYEPHRTTSTAAV
jgi:lipopolysaccharide/colanic/teichoic acid biosynthesis glycosyltransferase